MERLQGLIQKSIAGFYYVEVGDVVFECRARGAFRKEGITPLTGDLVQISVDQNQKGMVEEIIDRKNFLIRPPIANIAKLYIIVSVADPVPNLLVIDKLLSIAEDRCIHPVLVLNKTDLGDPQQITDIYQKAGYDVLTACAKTGEGCQEIRNSFSDGINVFTGNSGVGKSSLLNCIDPRLTIATNEISQKLGRGKHTTRHAQLYPLPNGGYVADTAGFSSVDLAEYEQVLKENLAFSFKEFAPALGKCKFSSCSHTGDAGCAVKQLVDQGNIALSRYENYCSLYQDMKSKKERGAK